MGSANVEEGPAHGGPSFLSALISLLLSPIQGIIAVAWTLFGDLMVSRLRQVVGVNFGRDLMGGLLFVGECSVLAAILGFSLARFFPVLAKGSHLTWLFGMFVLIRGCGGPFPSFTAVREAFSSPPTAELKPVAGTAIGVCLCSYSAFALLGTWHGGRRRKPGSRGGPAESGTL